MSESFKFMQIKVLFWIKFKLFWFLIFYLNRFGAKMETQAKKHKLNGDGDLIVENKKKKNKKEIFISILIENKWI